MQHKKQIQNNTSTHEIIILFHVNEHNDIKESFAYRVRRIIVCYDLEGEVTRNANNRNNYVC